jgi:protein SCO1/2
MRGRRTLLGALATLVLLAACEPPPGATARPAFKAIDITGADYARGFELPDASGKLRTLADFKGQVVVVFFGFTHCPDVCPSTMAELAEVKRQLGPDGEKLRAVFITVDPERDTPQVLGPYVSAFDPAFVALRGTPEQTREVAKSFKVHFQQTPGSTPGSYTVDHTAGSFVFDPQGRVRLFVRYGSGADALLHDIRLLLQGA